MKLTDYIKVYDNVLSEDFCKSLINSFEDTASIAHDTEYLKFNQININTSPNQFCFLDDIFEISEQVSARYFKDCNIQYVPNYAYEHCKMKKYSEGGYFGPHIDSADTSSGNRFLVLLYYLNTVEIGGETEFVNDLSVSVKPVQGSVLVFPSNFLYPHRANIPSSNSKYIMSTYLRCN